MKIQITLTVSEAKVLIAKAVVARDDVKQALTKGRVLLKGGTTVSAIAEEIIGTKLRIGGRVTPRGTMNTLKKYDQFHCIVIENGESEGIDKNIDEVVGTFGRDDVIITSGNALDIHGEAAMMAAAPLGHRAGMAVSGFMSQGSKVIIAIGLEKLIPGTIREAIQSSGRVTIDRSFGSAVGLIPLIGEVVTEIDAITGLAEVKATVISAGGIRGAEGATTLVVEGSDTEVEKIYDIVAGIKGAVESGTPESLVECERGCPQCKRHLACVYKLGLIENQKREN